MIRRMRTLLPTYLSTGLGAFDISGTPREQAERKRLQLGAKVSQSHNGIWERCQNANGAVLLSTGGMPHAGENFVAVKRSNEKEARICRHQEVRFAMRRDSVINKPAATMIAAGMSPRAA